MSFTNAITQQLKITLAYRLKMALIKASRAPTVLEFRQRVFITK